jgi:hypothetical protein
MGPATEDQSDVAAVEPNPLAVQNQPTSAFRQVVKPDAIFERQIEAPTEPSVRFGSRRGAPASSGPTHPRRRPTLPENGCGSSLQADPVT